MLKYPICICIYICLFLISFFIFKHDKFSKNQPQRSKNVKIQEKQEISTNNIVVNSESNKNAADYRVTEVEIYARDKAIRDKALIRAQYKCEIDQSHNTFISNNTNQNYAEVHHIIPLRFQNQFKDKLDNIDNLIVLCPTCHKLLHYAAIGEKIELLKCIYEKRNLVISIEELIKLYD